MGGQATTSGHPPYQATRHIRPHTISGHSPHHHAPPPYQATRHIIKPRHHISPPPPPLPPPPPTHPPPHPSPPAISSSPATISGHPPQATRKGWPYYIRCGCGSASRVGRAKARPVIRSLVKRANEVTG